MDVKVSKSGGCRLTVDIAVPAVDVRPEYDKVVKFFSKKARIPGFRPGKAPVALVETRFRKDIIKQVQDQMLPVAYQNMLKQESLEPVAVVGVSDVNLSADHGLSFQVVLDVAPEFKLPKYQKIPVGAVHADVSEDDVNKGLEQLLKRYSRYEDLPEGRVQDQDMVQVTYSGTCGGQPMSDMALKESEMAAGEDFWLPIVSESEFLPGLNAALTGTALGQTITLDVTFPDDYRVADLAGRQAVYTIAVKALRRMKTPVIDEAFLKELGVDSEEVLRQQVREGIEAEKKAAEASRQHQEISKFLVEHTKIEVPESQVAQETSALLRSLLERMARAGGTKEMLEQHREEIMGSVSQQAQDRVKLQYIGQAIAKAENITVSDADVAKELEGMAVYYGMTADKLRAEIEKQETGMAQLRKDIQHARVLEFLLGEAKIK
jgi:trigger factor